MLTALVEMVPFKPWGHIYDSRYSEQTILTFLGIPRLAENDQLGYFTIIAKIVGSRYLISNRKGIQCILCT